MPPACDISFVIISYNDAFKLGRAISSAALASAHGGLDYEILVADNGSADHTADLLAEFGRVLGPRLRPIALDHNTGTTYPRNLAMRQSGGRFICVMDSDAEIMDHDLSPVLRLLADFPEIGIVGPRIIMPDGSTYDSAKKLPTLTDKLLKIPGVLLSRPTINRDWYPGFPFGHITPVHSVISCCWFFRRELFERIGPPGREDILRARGCGLVPARLAGRPGGGILPRAPGVAPHQAGEPQEPLFLYRPQPLQGPALLFPQARLLVLAGAHRGSPHHPPGRGVGPQAFGMGRQGALAAVQAAGRLLAWSDPQ